MRIAVVGGTGLVGRHLVRVLKTSGHVPVVVARSTGVDASTGDGLSAALQGCDAVVDVTNSPSLDESEASRFFTGVTRNLIAAERDLGIGHHVLLSIVGIERMPRNPHFAAKLRQEQALQEGGVPHTIVRVTQFFEFAEQVVGWTRDGDTALVPPLLIQPIAAADAAAALADTATGPPTDAVVEVAGPRREDLVDMTRRILHARGENLVLEPTWTFGPFHTDMAGEVMLPGADARLASTDLDGWVATGASVEAG